MTKLQLIVLTSAVILFCGMYFGLDHKPKGHDEIEQARVQNSESTNINSIVLDARKTLTPEQSAVFLSLENELKEAEADSAKAVVLKKFSSNWYSIGRADIAGYFADEVAEIENTEEAWSIAGTTYLLGIQKANEQKIKDFCFGRAVKAFENTISINPIKISHKVNLALCYVENPPAENPMKGILMLRELNSNHPDDVVVLNNLARLAIRTNQFERATERLEKALSIQENNPVTICLLAQAYRGTGNTTKAEAFENLCAQLSKK